MKNLPTGSHSNLSPDPREECVSAFWGCFKNTVIPYLCNIVTSKLCILIEKNGSFHRVLRVLNFKDNIRNRINWKVWFIGKKDINIILNVQYFFNIYCETGTKHPIYIVCFSKKISTFIHLRAPQAFIWGSEKNLGKSVLSFHYVSPRNWIRCQAQRQEPYPLSHPTADPIVSL